MTGLTRRLLRPSIALLLLVALLAGLAAGLGGAALYSRLHDGAGFERGATIRVGANIDVEGKPFCVTSQHFCIVELELGRLAALYTYDPHPDMRSRGCDVHWLPEFRFDDRQGWLVGGCGGSIFELDGSLLFGPGPRDLDRFPLRLVEGPEGSRLIEVDTGELICGASRHLEDAECELAPLPQ